MQFSSYVAVYVCRQNGVLLPIYSAIDVFWKNNILNTEVQGSLVKLKLVWYKAAELPNSTALLYALTLWSYPIKGSAVCMVMLYGYIPQLSKGSGQVSVSLY